MKSKKLDLLGSVVGTYDQSKTTIKGNVFQKTISGTQYLGPSLNRWIDVITDTGITPTGVTVTSNGRLFVSSSETATTVSIAMYNFNFTDGSVIYVGKITMHLGDTAATTHTLRGFKVQDNAGTTGWKLFLVTTGTVAVNGGVYMVNKLDAADFTALGTDFPFATGNDLKATYFLQDPSNIGVGQLNISSAGVVLDSANNRLYVHNGVAATHQYYVYDTATAPVYTSAAVSVSVASPGKVTYNSHPFLVNDQVVFTGGTVPTGLVVGTTYFVRNPTANDFELSATSGGASINTTGSASVGATLGRAHGISGGNFVHKTGNLPALTGTLLLVDSEDYAVPNHTSNAGFPCAFFSTTSNMYLGKLSELTPGATTWTSLTVANVNPDPSLITQSVRAASWSNTLDRALFNSTGSIRFILKQLINNSADRVFGRTNIALLENTNPTYVYPGANTETVVVGMDLEQGWMFLAINQAGQRGIIAADIRSDSLFDYSYVISKTLPLSKATLKFISRWRALDTSTDNLQLYYRTSGFGSETGGWIALTAFSDLSSIYVDGQIQFKVTFDTFSREGKGLHAQINELFVGYDTLTEVSDNWEYSSDDSSNLSPSRVAFRLKEAYSTVVPTLNFNAYDLSDVLLVNHDSVTNASNFEYSTDNGMSWLPLGTIPNVVGTLVRYTFTSPPGVTIRPSLKD